MDTITITLRLPYDHGTMLAATLANQAHDLTVLSRNGTLNTTTAPASVKDQVTEAARLLAIARAISHQIGDYDYCSILTRRLVALEREFQDTLGPVTF